MAKLRPIQQSFKSGEISPKLRSRPDTEEYQQGAEFLQNFEVTPYGSVVRRGGSELISEISDTLIYGRVFNFRVEGSENYMIVVTEDEISVHNRSGVVPTENNITNPGFDEGGVGWNVTPFKDSGLTISEEPGVGFFNGFASVSSGNAAHLILGQGPGGPLPFQVDRDIDIVLNPSGVRLSQQVTVADGAGDYSLKIAVVETAFRAQGVLLDYLKIGTLDGGDDIPFTVDPTDSSTALFSPGTVSFWISYTLEWDDSLNVSEAGTGVMGNEGSSARVTIDSFTLLELGAPTSVAVEFPSPYTEQQVRELQVEKAPGLSTMYFVVRADFTHKKLMFDRELSAWSFIDVEYVGGAGDPPAEWEENGYPGSISFFQGRLWLAGSKGKPATVWGSVAGEDNYEDFTIGGAADDDALDLPLARDGVIQWIQGGKALVVGTDTAEHIIFGNAHFDLLLPSSARATQHSSYGSYRIHAEWLSEKISFVSQDQRRVYIGDYNRDTFGFVSDELSYIAEHITEGAITEIAYGQSPTAEVKAVLADGTISSCKYQRETQSIGWFRYNTFTGAVKSIAIVEEFGRAVAWILVERLGKLLLERFSDTIFLDSYVIRQYETAQNTVDGLDHLEGLLVDVLADAAYVGRYVVESGQVQIIQGTAQTFVVGLPYMATLKTLPVESLNQSENLTAKLRKWNRIYVRLLASALPRINGVRPPDRTPSTPMDTREPDKSQDVSVATTGRDRNAHIIIEQDLPFACEVVGVYGELSEDGY